MLQEHTMRLRPVLTSNAAVVSSLGGCINISQCIATSRSNIVVQAIANVAHIADMWRTTRDASRAHMSHANVGGHKTCLLAILVHKGCVYGSRV